MRHDNFNTFASKEDRKTLTTIQGEQTKTYTKSDFLSASQLVKELGLSKDVIEKAMRDMKRKQTKVIFNNHKALVVIGRDAKNLRVHPMGLSVFKEYVLQQKEAKK